MCSILTAVLGLVPNAEKSPCVQQKSLCTVNAESVVCMVTQAGEQIIKLSSMSTLLQFSMNRLCTRTLWAAQTCKKEYVTDASDLD